MSWSHAFIVLSGAFVALTAMIAWMDRAIQRERQSTERRAAAELVNPSV